MRLRSFVAIASLALLMSSACGGEEGAGNQLAEAGSGGDAGTGGTAGLAEGGTGGDDTGTGGVGGTGGAEAAPCTHDVQSEACQSCVSTALLSCSVSGGCGDSFVNFASCGAAAECVTDTGLDFACAAQACPTEAIAVAQCLAGCPEMRACAGF